MKEFDRTKSIRCRAGSLADRVEFIPDAPLSVIADISQGIFFVMAFWSGGSIQSFQRLVDVVGRLDPGGQLRIVVADTDCIPHFYETPPFQGNLHGWGETYWIKKGRIVAESGRGLNLECIEPNTVALLGGAT